jgi:hypothetical protein
MATLLPGAVFASEQADEPPPSSLTNTLNRPIEPVVVTGVLIGKPVDEIFVYRWNSGSWQQIPFQVDERNSSGALVAAEDGVMDSNDEVVFLSGDTGDMASDLIGNALPISGLWYRVEVVDPINPSSKGWAYVVHSTTLSVTNPTDYVTFTAGNRRVTTDNYSLGWAATGHNGLDYMSMSGGGDILDRTKLRIDYRFIVLIQLTEEDVPLDSLTLIKDGAVRTLVSRGTTITESYDALSRTVYPINLSTLPGTLEKVRTSIDLAQGVTGTYYDENNPGGVAINGVPDSVAATPFNQAWRQVTVGAGANIQVARLNELGGTRRHYYKDNAAVDPSDTGDQRSIGDSGFEVTMPDSENFTIITAQYFLPAAAGNQGSTYNQYFLNPLQVSATAEAEYRLYLPTLLKG